jgi:hypothetical protein
VDVGEHTSRRDGDAAEQLVQLLVVLDGKGDMTGHDASLLVVAGGITSKLQDLGAEILENGGEVDRGIGIHAGGVLSLAEVAADTAHGELKSCLGRGGSALLLTASSFTFSGHCWYYSFDLGMWRSQRLRMDCLYDVRVVALFADLLHTISIISDYA